MSDFPIELRALLADATQCGMYFVDARDREALAIAAKSLDFAQATIDLAGCSGKDDALARFARALAFPEWFGGNWDALADCLSDLSWWPADGYVLLLEHVNAWRAAAPEDFDTLVDIVNETATGWARLRKPFWALMPLPADALAAMAD
jgi:RNAse (barnase) inhibitor barstar